MRPSRLVPAALSAMLLSVTALFAAAPADAAGANYAALGDSYSSGVGAGSYDSTSGSCERSTVAYPALWASANAPSSFHFVACSGARTTDVINNQLGALSSSTSLVSITIGGNDAGFANTMTTCVLYSTDDCLAAVADSEAFAENQLPALLDQTYTAIRSHAPNAKVVVLDYPHLYQVPGTCIVGISDTSRTAINQAADILDGVISKAAADHGFTFSDVRDDFAGHEICGNLTRWLHSTTYPVDESYHPNADGQRYGYYPAFGSVA